VVKKKATAKKTVRAVKKVDSEHIFGVKKHTVKSENAGSFKVSQSVSNIKLYPHQKAAIQKMDGKMASARSFAGILVLPTGGGKTLTA
jgi:superfamily II DNA or RNA helicase